MRFFFKTVGWLGATLCKGGGQKSTRVARGAKITYECDCQSQGKEENIYKKYRKRKEKIQKK